MIAVIFVKTLAEYLMGEKFQDARGRGQPAQPEDLAQHLRAGGEGGLGVHAPLPSRVLQ